MAIKTNLQDLKPARERFKRVVSLVSGGKPNEKYFPGGKITVFPWDHTVDDWIANRVRNGGSNPRTLTFDLLPKLCNLNGCEPGDFLGSEVTLVLLVSRGILMNDTLEFKHQCPKCGAQGKDKIKIPDQLSRNGEKATDWPGWDIVNIPDAKDAIKLRPATVSEEVRILNRSENERKALSDTLFRFSMVIKEVNGGAPDSAAEIVQYLNALSPHDIKFLQEHYDKLQPGLSTELQLKCDSCGSEYEHNLRLDEDFFRRVSDSRT